MGYSPDLPHSTPASNALLRSMSRPELGSGSQSNCDRYHSRNSCVNGLMVLLLGLVGGERLSGGWGHGVGSLSSQRFAIIHAPVAKIPKALAPFDNCAPENTT